MMTIQCWNPRLLCSSASDQLQHAELKVPQAICDRHTLTESHPNTGITLPLGPAVSAVFPQILLNEETITLWLY